MVGARSLQAAVDRFVVEAKVPGAVVASIDSSGDVSCVARGVRDLATGEAMTPETTFRLASSTKTFTAATVFRLVEQGELTLGTPVLPFVPDSLSQRLHALNGVNYGHELTVGHL